MVVKKDSQNVALFNKEVAKDVIDKFYVDNYLDSFCFLEEAILFTSRGVPKILAKSSFELTKWSSNASKIIKKFPESGLSPNQKINNRKSIWSFMKFCKGRFTNKSGAKIIPSNKTWNFQLYQFYF